MQREYKKARAIANGKTKTYQMERSVAVLLPPPPRKAYFFLLSNALQRM